MKIVYNTPLDAYHVKRKLENNRTYTSEGKETVIMYSKDDQLFLDVVRGKMSTTYKVIVTDEYVQLKYSGIFSYMNIFLGIFWGIIPIVFSIVLLILMIIANHIRESGSIIGMIPISIGLLWIFIINDRIKAKRFIKKQLDL